MKAIKILSIPSLEKFNYLFQARCESLIAKLATYVFTPSVNGSVGDIPLLTRMALVRKLFSTENKPFYAADVFGECPELGGWMNGLSVAGLISATGNTRPQFIPIDFDDSIFKEIQVKEWTVAVPMEDLLNAYSEVKQFICDQM